MNTMNTNCYLQYDIQAYKKLITQLLKLKPRLYRDNCRHERAVFAYTTLKYYLLSELRNDNSLPVKQGLSEQDFDTCFEMFDGSLIVYKIMLNAKDNPKMIAAIKNQLGDNVYLDWCKSVTSCSGYQTDLF